MGIYYVNEKCKFYTRFLYSYNITVKVTVLFRIYHAYWTVVYHSNLAYGNAQFNAALIGSQWATSAYTDNIGKLWVSWKYMEVQ